MTATAIVLALYIKRMILMILILICIFMMLLFEPNIKNRKYNMLSTGLFPFDRSQF